MSTSYIILSSILLSTLIPYADEIIGDHHGGVQHNRSMSDQLICIQQFLGKKWKYNGTVP
jgi:hypothetical protein